MTESKLAGLGKIHHRPHEGADLRGMMLETFCTKATIKGLEGEMIVKRKDDPAGVSADAVQAAPEGHLGAYPVMVGREAGYCFEDKDWFWAKYLSDGTLDKMPDVMPMAGQIAKGMDEGCIACHRGRGDHHGWAPEASANLAATVRAQKASQGEERPLRATDRAFGWARGHQACLRRQRWKRSTMARRRGFTWARRHSPAAYLFASANVG
jgi:hypothetical protein